MNRTRGFVNLNRFKSAKAIKRHVKVTHGKRKKRGPEKPPVSYGFGA